MKKAIEAIQKKANEMELAVTDARGVIMLAESITITTKGLELTDQEEHSIALGTEGITELLEATADRKHLSPIYETNAWNDEVAPRLQKALGIGYKTATGKTMDEEDAPDWDLDPRNPFEVAVIIEEDKEILATAKIGEYLIDPEKRQELIDAIETIREYDRCEEFGFAGLDHRARQMVKEAYTTEMEGWLGQMSAHATALGEFNRETEDLLRGVIDTLIADEEPELEEELLASIEGSLGTADEILQDAERLARACEKAKEALEWCCKNMVLMTGHVGSDLLNKADKKMSEAKETLNEIKETRDEIAKVLDTIHEK